MRLHIDIESRSVADLTAVGVYLYAIHPTTLILCVAWAINADPVAIWYPRTEPIPTRLGKVLADPAVLLTAHNAGFERTMLSGPPGQAIGCPPGLDDTARWDCTAARAALIGLPRSLDGACSALRLAVQKDAEGAKIMRTMMRPKPVRSLALPGDTLPGIIPDGPAPHVWIEDDASMRRLGAYCVVDVEAERAIGDRIPEFSPFERQVWLMTERMNDRGVRADSGLIDMLADLIERATASLNLRLRQLTGGAVPAVSDHGALTRWLNEQGVQAEGVSKPALVELLARPNLPDAVRAALQIRADGAPSASKYRSIKARKSPDGRVRGALVYCGAAMLGRWSSRGVQLHNLPRGGLIKAMLAIRDILAGATVAELEDLHGPALVVASELLRPVFIV